MRLEKLRREFMPFADFRPVVLIHWNLGPRFGVEVGVTPDRRHCVGGSDGGLLAEPPAVHQLVDVSHATFPPEQRLVCGLFVGGSFVKPPPPKGEKFPPPAP